METVFDVIQSLQLNFSQAMVTGVLIFILGFIAGALRTRRLAREKQGLEETVMALNAELLYGTPSNRLVPETESTTPVIGLKTKNYKNPPVAK